jgi:hypothetical protein
MTDKRLNPLHTPEFIAKHVANTGFYFPEERATGRSTAQALRAIAAAINQPYTAIDLKDHSGTPGGNRYLLEQAKKMVAQLELKHFVFNTARTTIQFGQ